MSITALSQMHARALCRISGGLAVLTQGAQDRWVNSYASQVRGLAQRLATQGITVYPVQATGLQLGIPRHEHDRAGLGAKGRTERSSCAR